MMTTTKGEVQLEPPGVQHASDTDPLLKGQDESAPGSPSEIRDDRDRVVFGGGGGEGEDEDLEAGSVPCCRICLESECEPGDELISPCMCKGTQQFVHRCCLDHWRSVKEGFAFSHCTTCKAQFHLRVALFEDNTWRKVKFRLFVARDVFLVFLAVQTVSDPPLLSFSLGISDFTLKFIVSTSHLLFVWWVYLFL